MNLLPLWQLNVHQTAQRYIQIILRGIAPYISVTFLKDSTVYMMKDIVTLEQIEHIAVRVGCSRPIVKLGLLI